MFVVVFLVIATHKNRSQDLLEVVEHLDSLEEQERRYSAGEAGTAEHEAAVLKNSRDLLHKQPIDSQALRAEVSAKPVWVFFSSGSDFASDSPLRLLAGGAVAPSAGGSHRSSGCKSGVEEPLHPGPAEGAGQLGHVAESAAEHGADPALQHCQEAGRPPVTGGSPTTRQILQQGESQAYVKAKYVTSFNSKLKL